MRGKVWWCLAGYKATGITPAHAGKSIETIYIGDAEQDHPRPCGEKILNAWDAITHGGSPPPMRGKARRIAANARAVRITPAHAGKSTG